MSWTKDSWRNYKALQQPTYEDKELLKACEKELESFPPLIFAGEIRDLKAELAKVCRGEAFLLQGGDCAESFSSFNANNIRDMFRLFLQMALVLSFGAGMPVIKVARMAGQFAKPRSSDYEEKNGISLPSFRGDIINELEFSEEARKANPKKMLQAYMQSASTLNLLRGFCFGGFADLNEVHKWNLGFVRKKEIDDKYEDLVNKLTQTLNFLKACNINAKNTPQIHQTSLFTSHEALLLPYEEALTRVDSLSGDYYALSAHMLWIGERTRGIDDAHVHFLSGVKNPIGVKIGPTATSSDILKLAAKLNPQNEEGRLNIIIRMGADKIDKILPNIFKDISKEGLNIVYSIDPMHGNTIKTGNNYKTREFDAILKEVTSFFDISKAYGINPGGVHFEMTGQDVTECIGGSFGVNENDLKKRYETQCDPRLNANQALELAFLIADLYTKHKR